MNLSDRKRQRIVHFVKEILGCRCSDEVFRSIETGPGPEIEGALRVRERIVVGERLLIYLADALRDEDRRQSVKALLKQGVRDRDEHGLKRFRLVLALDGNEKPLNQKEEIFKTLELPDERIHLHTVPVNCLP